MRFGILGPLTVQVEGRQRRVPPGRQRALLTLLLLRVGETVSTDLLAEVLWGEDPPKNATNALQGRVSQLRKTLQLDDRPAVLRQRASGYCLDVPAEGIDAHRFSTACDNAHAQLTAGRTEEAAVTFDEALALWRGRALEDVADEAWALPDTQRLDELRLLMVEGRAAARLTLGEDITLVAELEEALAAHPLREALRGHLMVALYRSGRQVDALATYNAGRVQLAEDLGIDPGPRLQDLQQRILEQDPNLLGPPRPRGHEHSPDAATVTTTPDSTPASTGGSEAIRVLIVDDHAVVRRGLAAFLEQIDDLAVVGQAADGTAALAQIAALTRDGVGPDVVLMDVLMAGMDGVATTSRIRQQHPDVRVVMVTSFVDADKISGALEAGASGYVVKHAEADEVARAIRAAHRGEVQLDGQAAQALGRALATPATAPGPSFTEREEEVLELLAEGASNQEIAEVLSISERTARSHLSAILSKLGVRSRTQAALWASRHKPQPSGAS